MRGSRRGGAVSGGLAIADLKLSHQQQIEHAVRFVRLEDDDGSPGMRLRHEVCMCDFKGPPIRHADFEWAKRLQVQRRSELLGGHDEIIAGNL